MESAILNNNDFTPYANSGESLMDHLGTSKRGLSAEDVKKRLEKYGYNRLSVKKAVSPLMLFFRQLNNGLTIVLLGAVGAVLMVYFFGDRHTSDLIEAGLIFSIVMMIALLGFFQEYKAERALEALKSLMAYRVIVRRNNEEKEIDVTDLVPGDIVMIEEGLKVPADIRIIESVMLTVNEASLTGESMSVEKHNRTLSENTTLADRRNMLFAGTVVTSGRGTGIVTATGDKTQIGLIAGMVSSVGQELTPTQKRLNKIGKVIGYMVGAVCVVVFVFIFFLNTEYSQLPLNRKLIQSFIAAIALAVAAIPEGLPAVVTIALALGTQRMARKNALVRKLTAVETLGSVDVICTDKTGTLTKNEMAVREIYSDKLTGSDTTDVLEAGYYCNNARESGDGKFSGDPTEVALMVSANKAGIIKKYERVFEIPFDSSKKMMTVVTTDKERSRLIVFSKGAPEEILEQCDIKISEKKKILKHVDKMNRSALRTLAFASEVITAEEFEAIRESHERKAPRMRFVGLQGMLDPERDDVGHLIDKCQKSGIRVIMITGDHSVTARAIAGNIGIDGEAVSGDEVDKMNDKVLYETVKKVSIYARANPGTKMRIVEALKKQGHTVAMTGDGVNDAPALKKADVGISMGITGTDVAKEASDMVLLDDSFRTIVDAIEEGRGIYQNIKKFVQYLLACNIGEVILIFSGVVLFNDLILSASMLLWINVVTDGLPAVALALDKADKSIMSFKPGVFKSEIISKSVVKHMAFFGVLFAVVILYLYYIEMDKYGMTEARSSAFVGSVILQLVYLFITRKFYKTHFLTNRWLWISIGLVLILQMIIAYVPLAARLFETTPPNSLSFVYIIAMGIMIFALFEIYGRMRREAKS